MDWKSVIGVVAPTLATALGGPLAGLAVEALGKAIGIDQPTVEKVKDAFAQGQLTGEQISQIKQAEIALQLRMRELDISEQQLYAGDLDSARKMQIATQSAWPGVLSAFVTAGFFGVLGFLLVCQAPEQGRDVINIMLGSLGTAWISVISYYFGSSLGSSEKNKLLAQNNPK